MFHVKHLHDGVVLTAIETLREHISELEHVRLVRPWAVPALIAAIQDPISGVPIHRTAQQAARAGAEAVMRLEPLDQGNQALAGLMAVLVLNFAGEEVTLEETIERSILPHPEH